MKAAWISTWNRPIPGREARALEAFMTSQDFWGKLQADGRVESVQTFLSPAGHGMAVVKGERAQLNEIMDSEDWLRLSASVELNVEGLRGEFMTCDDSTDRIIGIWAEVAKEQGYL